MQRFYTHMHNVDSHKKLYREAYTIPPSLLKEDCPFVGGPTCTAIQYGQAFCLMYIKSFPLYFCLNCISVDVQ